MMTAPVQHTRIAESAHAPLSLVSDPVGIFLDQLGIRCRVIGACEVADGDHLPLRECQAGFCLLTSGEAVVSLAGKEGCELAKGDIALFLREDRRSPVAISLTQPQIAPNSNLQQLFRSQNGAAAKAVYGIIEFRADAGVLTAGSLPGVIRLQPRPARDRTIDMLLDTAITAADSQQSGRLALLNQLVSTICLEALREHVSVFDTEICNRSHAWLAALRDAEVGLILAEMLLHPEQDWTVESLADLVPMARSTFARKFRQLTGGSPMSVLLDIRMRNARDLLRSSRPLKDVARHAGYRSLSAFSSAFRRWSGQTPQSYRFELDENGGTAVPNSPPTDEIGLVG